MGPNRPEEAVEQINFYNKDGTMIEYAEFYNENGTLEQIGVYRENGTLKQLTNVKYGRTIEKECFRENGTLEECDNMPDDDSTQHPVTTEPDSMPGQVDSADQM